MFSPDKPIDKVEEDVLGRSEFAEHLAEALLNNMGKENFCVGINGKWGSGKTSFLNILELNISQKAQTLDKTKRPLIIKFNPWLFSDQYQLVDQFFRQLSDGLKSDFHNANINDIGNLMSDYADSVSCLSAVPVVGVFSGILASMVKACGKTILRKHKENTSTASIKDKITNTLSQLDNKII